MTDQAPARYAAVRHAVLAPHAAVWVVRQLRRAKVTSEDVRRAALFRREAGRADLADDLVEAWQQLMASAASVNVTSVDGRAEVVSAEVESRSDREVTTSHAAAALAVTDRRVRQMLGDGRLVGRKVGRVWWVDAASLDAHRDARAS